MFFFFENFLDPKASHELYKSFLEKLNDGLCQKELFFMKKGSNNVNKSHHLFLEY